MVEEATPTIIEDLRSHIAMADDDSFDVELVMYANAAIANLYRSGVTVLMPAGLLKAQWSELVDHEKLDSEFLLSAIKVYIFGYVGLAIDPPAPSAIPIIQAAVDQAAWTAKMFSESNFKEEEEILNES